MALDIASLIAPLSEDAPSGPDLGFDIERQEIESAFERSISLSEGEADEIDWRATINLIVAQAQKTRDLWLAVYLMRAAAQSGNFELVVDGADFMAGLLEERWADFHPQLEEYEFIGRKAPVESLTKLADFINPMNRLVLIEHPRLGRYTGADFLAFAKKGANAPNFGMFRALIESSDTSDLEAVVGQFDRLRKAIERVDAVMTEHAEGDTSTNFDPTYEQIDALRKAVAAQIPGFEQAAAEEGDSWASDSSTAGRPSGDESDRGFSGGIGSRDDVMRALDAICVYYSRYEPTSPVPLALQRAREWISLDFMAVLEDIAPGSLDEAKRVLTSGRKISVYGSSSAPEWEEPSIPSVDESSSEGGW